MTLTARLRAWASGPIETIARALIALRLTPNSITVIGLLIAALAAWLAATGRFLPAGIVLAAGSIFDAFDGAVARLSGRVTRFGALLDSTLDRYSEALLLASLAYWFVGQGRIDGVMLCFASLLGSIMVSYVRARSEGLAIRNEGGFFSRVERVVLLVLALLTGWLIPALWLLAIGSNITALQRLYAAAIEASRAEAGGSE